MLTDIEAVIFDMDGSLVDSMWIWTEVDRIFMEKYGLVPPKDFHKAIEGKSYTETAMYFLEAFPELNCTLEDVCAEWMEMTMEIYQTRVFLKPGAEAFLKQMKDNGVLLGIATSNARQLALAALDALDIRSYFQSVHTADEVSKGKPAPDVYLKVAEDLGVLPSKCLVFEDVPNGIRAGKNAGMKVCAVEDAFSMPMEQEKRRLADYYIRDFEEIRNKMYDVCGE